MKLTEVELQGTSRAEILYFIWSQFIEHGFGIPRVWNCLFSDFQKKKSFEQIEKINKNRNKW